MGADSALQFAGGGSMDRCRFSTGQTQVIAMESNSFQIAAGPGGGSWG